VRTLIFARIHASGLMKNDGDVIVKFMNDEIMNFILLSMEIRIVSLDHNQIDIHLMLLEFRTQDTDYSCLNFIFSPHLD